MGHFPWLCEITRGYVFLNLLYFVWTRKTSWKKTWKKPISNLQSIIFRPAESVRQIDWWILCWSRSWDTWSRWDGRFMDGHGVMASWLVVRTQEILWISWRRCQRCQAKSKPGIRKAGSCWIWQFHTIHSFSLNQWWIESWIDGRIAIPVLPFPCPFRDHDNHWTISARKNMFGQATSSFWLWYFWYLLAISLQP